MNIAQIPGVTYASSQSIRPGDNLRCAQVAQNLRASKPQRVAFLLSYGPAVLLSLLTLGVAS